MGCLPPPEALGPPQAGPVADQTGLCPSHIHHKVVQGSLWDDALQRTDSEAAIESSWRCKFVEMAIFVVHWGLGVPVGPKSVPGWFQGRAWGGPRRSLGAPGTPRGPPGSFF